MRGLCLASHLQRVQDEICDRPMLLRQVFLDLSGEIPASLGDDRLAHLAPTSSS